VWSIGSRARGWRSHPCRHLGVERRRLSTSSESNNVNELTAIYMRDSYTNKIVLVTGGTSGIGKATALAFAEAGAKVVITGRREKEGADVAAEITKNGGTAAFVRADVAKEADVVKAIDFVLSTHGRLDVAFNNAGVEIAGPLLAVTEEQYARRALVNIEAGIKSHGGSTI
jgi:NAD(P)-dependent dehydrogenase (short-subunit alcohol dehydrogenase family)